MAVAYVSGASLVSPIFLPLYQLLYLYAIDRTTIGYEPGGRYCIYLDTVTASNPTYCPLSSHVTRAPLLQDVYVLLFIHLLGPTP